MTTATPASPAKLPSGDWGARPASPVAVGDLVQITTRAGKSWTAEVVSIHGDVVATRSTDRAAVVAPMVAPSAGRSITVERVGRRSYLRGDTISVRGLLRDGGCHWDADAKAWWIGSHDDALALAERAKAAPAEAAPKKRITRCCNPACGCSLDDYTQRRGFRFCSRDCSIEARNGSAWSGYVDGVWHQGSDD